MIVLVEILRALLDEEKEDEKMRQMQVSILKQEIQGNIDMAFLLL
jgi:hypothetical protein